MTKSKMKSLKPLHKTPVKKIPKPALDFDRDKNLTYLPQDESLDPLLRYPLAYENDVERPSDEMPAPKDHEASQAEILSETKGGFIEDAKKEDREPTNPDV